MEKEDGEIVPNRDGLRDDFAKDHDRCRGDDDSCYATTDLSYHTIP